jgi:hypothetical protein
MIAGNVFDCVLKTKCSISCQDGEHIGGVQNLHNDERSDGVQKNQN